MKDELRIEQCDRDAAADLLDELSGLLAHNGLGQVADLIRDGEYDDQEATSAFARHRLAAIQRTNEMAAKNIRQEAARLRGIVLGKPMLDSLTRGIADHLEHRATAIEANRSEEHTSELQSLMRISYAVFCLK